MKTNNAFIIKNGFTIKELSYSSDEVIMQFDNRSYEFTADLTEDGVNFFKELAADYFIFLFVPLNSPLLEKLNEIPEHIILCSIRFLNEDEVLIVKDKDLKMTLYEEFCRNPEKFYRGAMRE